MSVKLAITTVTLMDSVSITLEASYVSVTLATLEKGQSALVRVCIVSNVSGRDVVDL